MKGYRLGMLALILVSFFQQVRAEEGKPLGYASLVEHVLEFPGLNAQGGAYWDAVSSGEFALGASAALFRFGESVDLRLGYIVHDPKVWGGTTRWECQLLALSAETTKLGLKPIKLLEGSSVSLWAGKNFFAAKDSPSLPGENPWRGGLNLTYAF